MAPFPPVRHRSRLFLAAALALCTVLAACGFHLKGATPVPFKTLYTNINLDTEFGARLQRTILSNSPDTRFTGRRSEADAYLHQISDEQNLRQVSLDAEGRVEEYELELIFTFEVLDRAGHLILPPTTLHSLRELPYNERIVQAKESEITRTFANMRNGLIDQILRRLSAPEIANAYADAANRPVVEAPSEPAPAGPPASPLSRPGSPATYP
ncbi:LPS-assembly lipoprotein LptE [Castellaniella sp. S9]|uniref:LPS-assembly lipoprotein LptE n=1 Tax=Castellaniella sp. S9 TaxID=2993652 RepID=UPI0022B5D364|nr:LPS assembly lipoprotein LptE [Castellaniella sp. S9]